MRKKKPTKDRDFSAIAVPSMRGEGYLDYKVESHPSQALQMMEELRHHGLLCDLVLHVTYKGSCVDFKVRSSRDWRAVTPGAVWPTTSRVPCSSARLSVNIPACDGERGWKQNMSLSPPKQPKLRKGSCVLEVV